MSKIIQIGVNAFRFDNGPAVMSLERGSGPTLYERFLARFAPARLAEQHAAEMERISGCTVVRFGTLQKAAASQGQNG
jgi:hypothetical protein